MINYNEKYLKIKDRLIQESFPELRKKKIFIGEIWMRKHYSGAAFYIPPFRFIGLNRRLRKNSSKIVTGIVVHELCHFALIEERGFIKSLIRIIGYWIGSELRRTEEDAVNKLAVQKGYSREIYAAFKEIEFIKKKAKIQKYYMSAEEIKNYAKSIGKW